MFHKLHRLLVFVCWGLVVCAAVYVYQQRAVFNPAVDLVSAWRIREGFAQSDLGRIRGRVTRVNTGDTFQLVDREGRLHQIRLTGMSAPEFQVGNKRVNAIAGASRDSLKSLVLSNEVQVAITYTNGPRDGLGLVYLGMTNVNAAQILAGQAKAREDYMNGLPLKERYFLLRAARFASERKESDSDESQ
jgi:endonuclease YncB( thermonuclease family)